MASVQIDGQMYRIVEVDAFGMPELLETSDGVFRVVEWHDIGMKALALEQPSPAWLARQQAFQAAEAARAESERAARETAEEAKFEAWARKRGLIVG